MAALKHDGNGGFKITRSLGEKILIAVITAMLSIITTLSIVGVKRLILMSSQMDVIDERTKPLPIKIEKTNERVDDLERYVNAIHEQDMDAHRLFLLRDEFFALMGPEIRRK